MNRSNLDQLWTLDESVQKESKKSEIQKEYERISRRIKERISRTSLSMPFSKFTSAFCFSLFDAIAGVRAAQGLQNVRLLDIWEFGKGCILPCYSGWPSSRSISPTVPFCKPDLYFASRQCWSALGKAAQKCSW